MRPRPEPSRRDRSSQPGRFEQPYLELPLPPPPRRSQAQHDEERERGVWIVELG